MSAKKIQHTEPPVEATIVPVVERFFNEDSGYGVYMFITPDDIDNVSRVSDLEISKWLSEDLDDVQNKYWGWNLGTIAGNMQRLYIGSEYKMKGYPVYNARYNSYQYDAEIVKAQIPKTANEQFIFLRQILTERQANELMKHYPNIVNDVIDGNDDVDVSKLHGIGAAMWQKVKEKIVNNFAMADIIVMLQPYGVSLNKIQKLTDYEPNVEKLKEELNNNPYMLTDIDGFGFKTVDMIALKINAGLRDSEYRVGAFIRYYLADIGNNDGHTYIYETELRKAVQDMMPECVETYDKMIVREKNNPQILHSTPDGKVGLRKYYQEEAQTYQTLKDLDDKKFTLKVTENDVKSGIARAEKAQGFGYTDAQLQTIYKSLKNNVILISGKAGTGKSTIARGLLNIYATAGYSISCCALSAKAAQRAQEATGREAVTIHRLLGYNGKIFTYNKSHKLSCKVLFIDEASMINCSLFYSLIQAVNDGTKVIICGDDKQLPPIGCGNVFHDLLSSPSLVHNQLTEVLRQAQDSGILTDANIIRDGLNPINTAEKSQRRIIHGKNQDMIYVFCDDKDQAHNLALKSYMSAVEQDGVDNVLLLSPRHQSCVNCTKEFNKDIYDSLIPPSSECLQDFGYFDIRPNARIIQRQNDSSRDVYNGEIGYVDLIDEGLNRSQDSFVALYGGDKAVSYTRSDMGTFDLAYALTVHLAQGSGYDTVIIVLDTSSYILLDNCLLYTALTRAKKRCMLITSQRAYSTCLHKNHGERNTWLNAIIEREVKGEWQIKE